MSETPFVRHNPTVPCFGTIRNAPAMTSPYVRLAAMPVFSCPLAESIFRKRLTTRAYKFHCNDKAETMWDVMTWANGKVKKCDQLKELAS